MAKHARHRSLPGPRRVVVAMAVLTALSVTGLAHATQGDPDPVLTVDNPTVACASPLAAPRVQGRLGTTIWFSAAAPIAGVTLQARPSAVVVAARFASTWGQITLSTKVVSYVVWTCPAASTTSTTTSITSTSTVRPTTTGATRSAGARSPLAATSTGATTTRGTPTTSSGATSPWGGPTTSPGATSSSVGAPSSSASSTSLVGAGASARPRGGGPLARTGAAASLPLLLLLQALALLGLGTASVLAGRRRRRP
jgi:hypothetical protein